MLINDVKIKYVKWLLLWVCLYNVVILCNWVWLMIVLLLKSCNYWGDLVLEVKFFKVIIGEEMIQEKLDLVVECIFMLYCVYMVKLM